VAVASAGPYANLHLDPDITMPASHHSVFYRPDALAAPNQQRQSVEALKALDRILALTEDRVRWRQLVHGVAKPRSEDS